MGFRIESFSNREAINYHYSSTQDKKVIFFSIIKWEQTCLDYNAEMTLTNLHSVVLGMLCVCCNSLTAKDKNTLSLFVAKKKNRKTCCRNFLSYRK